MTTSIRTEDDGLSGALSFSNIDNIVVKTTGPELKGTPRAPTATLGQASTQIATTEFVINSINNSVAVSPSNAVPIVSGNGAPGTSNLYARGDHVHPSQGTIPSPSNTLPLTVGTVSVGTSSQYARGDHSHGSNVYQSNATPLPTAAVGSAGTNVQVSRADHVHADSIGSDRRLKTNIAPISDALVKLSQLGGYTFFRSDLDTDDAGVIAQEIQAVLPEGVKEWKEDPTGGSPLLGVRALPIIGLLIAAVNELSAKTKVLEQHAQNHTT